MKIKNQTKKESKAKKQKQKKKTTLNQEALW